MSSAHSITRSVNPPRAVYLDFPLGHTAGKANDPGLQCEIMLDTLQALQAIRVPGTILELPHSWTEDDAWKDRVMRPDPDGVDGVDGAEGAVDERIARLETVQYQCDEDRVAAEEALATGGCSSCIFLEDPPRG
jgi:hypothetical protein